MRLLFYDLFYEDTDYELIKKAIGKNMNYFRLDELRGHVRLWYKNADRNKARELRKDVLDNMIARKGYDLRPKAYFV